MDKQGKILIIITVLALGLVIYIIFSSKIVELPGENNVKKDTPAKEKITARDVENYKQEVRQIISDYDALIAKISDKVATGTGAGDDFVDIATDSPAVKNYGTRLNDLIAQLDGLIVPLESFKEAHLRLRIAFSGLENYLIDMDPDNLVNSMETVNQVKIDNDWLGG